VVISLSGLMYVVSEYSRNAGNPYGDAWGSFKMRFINPRQVWLLSYSFVTYKCFMGSISYILSKCYLINKVLKNYLFIHEKTNKRKNYSGVSGRIFTPQ
jgi:hypothetical protein